MTYPQWAMQCVLLHDEVSAVGGTRLDRSRVMDSEKCEGPAVEAIQLSSASRHLAVLVRATWIRPSRLAPGPPSWTARAGEGRDRRHDTGERRPGRGTPTTWST